MAAEAAPVASSIVPILDISALTSGDAAGKQELARRLNEVCMDIGFFVVVNHGVPQAAIDAAWQAAIDFFDLPLEEKLKMETENEDHYPYGYSRLGDERLSAGKDAEVGKESGYASGGDLKEMMQLGPKDPRAGRPPRRWPEHPQGFAEAWDRYYDEVNLLAQRLLGCIALALKLPEDWFMSKMDRHESALRANNYPDQQGMAKDVTANAIRCSAHTDYGTVTILRSGGPGLQVSKDTENPVWQDVPYVQDGFVINLGDLMRRWTNDRWSSTLHRVINPPAGQEEEWGRRLAIAFFHNLNKDAIVEAIESCKDDEHPQLYEPIVAGKFLMLKHMASMGKAAPDAHLQRRAVAAS